MSSDERIDNVDETRALLSRRMMQMIVWHRASTATGLDPIHVSHFQQKGLLEGLEPPPGPQGLAALLQNPEDPRYVKLPPGPLLFVRHNGGTVVIELCGLFLNPDQNIRLAALDVILKARTQTDAWLLEATVAAVAECADAIGSPQIGVWRDAGLKLVSVVRNDFLSHTAGLRQSIVGDFDEGLSDFLPKVLHPRFSVLNHLRPTLWSPAEQQDEISNALDRLASAATIEDALAEYLANYGYVPLCQRWSAAELVRRWFALHQDKPITFEAIRNWAVLNQNPMAVYHFVQAVMLSSVVDISVAPFELWTDITSVLFGGNQEGSADGAQADWSLVNTLASHFARHVETLWPGQDGNRIACYAWWLTAVVTKVFRSSGVRSEVAIEHWVEPAAASSYMSWDAARSPVVPSACRHGTLFMGSIWSMSLFAQLSNALDRLPKRPDNVIGCEQVPNIFRGYLVVSSLADASTETSLFAFDESSQLLSMCDRTEFAQPSERESLLQLIEYRRQLSNANEFRSCLERFEKLPVHEQHLTLLVMKEDAYSTTRLDNVILEWISKGTPVVDVLRSTPTMFLDLLLDSLVEFQQRVANDEATRLPHCLAHLVETTEDIVRLRHYYSYTLQMSLGAGVASPIQRIWASKKDRSNIAEPLKAWRMGLIKLTRNSEPWLAGRIRGILPALSKLIGPPRVELDDLTRFMEVGTDDAS